MTLTEPFLVSPDDYDSQIYNLLHEVLDRVVELGSKADAFDTESLDARDDDGDSDKEDDTEPLTNLLRSQANFTPAEKQELRATGALLNILISVAVTRRSGLYHPTEGES